VPPEKIGCASDEAGKYFSHTPSHHSQAMFARTTGCPLASRQVSNPLKQLDEISTEPESRLLEFKTLPS